MDIMKCLQLCTFLQNHLSALENTHTAAEKALEAKIEAIAEDLRDVRAQHDVLQERSRDRAEWERRTEDKLQKLSSLGDTADNHDEKQERNQHHDEEVMRRLSVLEREVATQKTTHTDMQRKIGELQERDANAKNSGSDQSEHGAAPMRPNLAAESLGARITDYYGKVCLCVSYGQLCVSVHVIFPLLYLYVK